MACGPRVDIEEPPHAGDHIEQMRAERATHADVQLAELGLVLHANLAGRFSKRRGSVVAIADDLLDAGRGPGLEELQHASPGEWPLDRDLKLELTGNAIGAPAERRRRATIDLVDHGIEPANASKARRLRNVRHRQAGRFDQPPRESSSPNARDLNGRRAEVLVEEPPKLARPNAEPLAQARRCLRGRARRLRSNEAHATRWSTLRSTTVRPRRLAAGTCDRRRSRRLRPRQACRRARRSRQQAFSRSNSACNTYRSS